MTSILKCVERHLARLPGQKWLEKRAKWRSTYSDARLWDMNLPATKARP